MVRKSRLIDTFLRLVQIDSPSGEEKAIAHILADDLKQLGGHVTFDTLGNLIAKFYGKGTPLLLSAHLDTIEPGRSIKPHITGDRIVSDGTTILGGDAKAGIAIILETVISMQEHNKQHVPLEIVFTLSEEVGLLGSKSLDYSLISAKQGIIFDGDGAVSHVTDAAPGSVRVEAVIHGIGAHAGVEPEKGLSAIQIAAKVISGLQLGRIDLETTANIGSIHGGTVANAIPETVTLLGEIRSLNATKLQKHRAHFEDVFKHEVGKYTKASYELHIVEKYKGYSLGEGSKIKKLVKKAYKQCGMTPAFHDSGGATDANNLHQHGIEAIVVGIGDYESHTTREYVLISQLLQSVQFCRAVIAS